MIAVKQEAIEFIGLFYDEIYRDSVGTACLALKSQDKTFSRLYYEWPTQRAELVQMTYDSVHSEGLPTDVYFAPSLFSGPHSTYEYLKGANCCWVL